MVVAKVRVSGGAGSSRPVADGSNTVVGASVHEGSNCDVTELTICDAADVMTAMTNVTADTIFLVLHKIRPCANLLELQHFAHSAQIKTRTLCKSTEVTFSSSCTK